MKRTPITTLVLVLCVLSLQLALGAGPSVAEQPAPMLRLDYVPAFGVEDSLEGVVLYATPGLAVTAYLQISEGGTMWGPKPTWASPSVPVENDGSWWLQFITGGNDIEAVALYVLLVPASYTPGGDYGASEAAALDKLVVTRSPDGAVTILPREGKWWRETPVTPTPPPATPTPRPATPTPQPMPFSGPPSNPRLTAPSISINYSPYTGDQQSPKLQSPIPAAQMSRQLRHLRPYVDTIRTFGVSGELAKLYPLAKAYGYRVIAGAWIEGGYTEAQIIAELDALIAVANRGECDIAVVGSECLHRGDFTLAEMSRYIAYVRSGISDKHLPVATSDTAAAWQTNPSLAAGCDVVLVTYYPFFDGVGLVDAPGAMAQMYEWLKAALPSKEIIISETGWPTAGSPELSAQPSEANAARYFREVYDWSAEEGVEVVYFSAYDEGWKIEGAFDDIGTHWGHFTADGVLKPAYRAIYSRTLMALPETNGGPSAAEGVADIYRLLGKCVGKAR